MKFLIKSTYTPAVYDGTDQVFGTGESPFTFFSEDLESKEVAEGKFRFITGLDKQDIQANPNLLKEEKEVFIKIVDQARERVKESHGDYALDPTNKVFWSGTRATATITNEIFSNVFDSDENIEHLIFRMQIIGGGYSSIAPNLEIAKRNGKKYYLTGDDEFTEKNYEEEYGVKRKAIAALSDLLDSKGIDPLLYITWNTLESNGGFTKNTSKAVFEKTLMEYIEGKHVKYGKKNCAKNFYDNCVAWKADKDQVIAKAIVNAAYYFGIIHLSEGKFKSSKKGSLLGSTIEETYQTLLKPEFAKEMIDIKTTVDEKLNS